MAETYTETTNQSWLSRIGNSIKGILFGIVVIPLMIILLWWNEGRAITTANSLKEGVAAVVSVSSDKLDPANDKKLIHVMGEARAASPVSDPEFGIRASALRLLRSEEIYQWVESKKSQTQEKLGGGEETITTYSYQKDWVSEPIKSADFKQTAEHANHGGLIAGDGEFVAEEVMLGNYLVPEKYVSRMGPPEKFSLIEDDLAGLTGRIKELASIQAGAFYFGETPDEPQIGDVRVSYEIVKAGTYSVLAAQVGNSFEDYATKAGDSISFVEAGSVSAGTMFKNAASANSMMTWLARFLGFLFMAFGFMAIMRPLSVLGSVIPFVGSIIGMSTGLISFVLAGTLSILVIAIAWIAVRPLLGITLLTLVIGGVIYSRKIAARNKPAIMSA